MKIVWFDSFADMSLKTGLMDLVLYLWFSERLSCFGSGRCLACRNVSCSLTVLCEIVDDGLLFARPLARRTCVAALVPSFCSSHLWLRPCPQGGSSGHTVWNVSGHDQVSIVADTADCWLEGILLPSRIYIIHRDLCLLKKKASSGLTSSRKKHKAQQHSSKSLFLV